MAHGQFSAHWCKIREVVTQLHNQNMVHGDLRDANIVVANDGSFMLIDFGYMDKCAIRRVYIQRPDDNINDCGNNGDNNNNNNNENKQW